MTGSRQPFPRPKAEETLLQRLGAHMLIGTPGRVRELIEKRVLLHVEGLRFLVLDEVDKLLSGGLEDDVRSILTFTRNPSRQILAFSATLPAWSRETLLNTLKEQSGIPRRRDMKKEREFGRPERESETGSKEVGDKKDMSGGGCQKDVDQQDPSGGVKGPAALPGAEDDGYEDRRSGALAIVDLVRDCRAAGQACDSVRGVEKKDTFFLSNGRPPVSHFVCRLPKEDSKRVRALFYLLKERMITPHPGHRAIIFCNSRQQTSLLAHHPLLESISKPLHADMPQNQRSGTLRAFIRGRLTLAGGS